VWFLPVRMRWLSGGTYIVGGTFAAARAERMDGAHVCRLQWFRGLRAAAAGCRRQQRGQEQGACASAGGGVWGYFGVVAAMDWCARTRHLHLCFQFSYQTFSRCDFCTLCARNRRAMAQTCESSCSFRVYVWAFSLCVW
jgi:hypothetical protein